MAKKLSTKTLRLRVPAKYLWLFAAIEAKQQELEKQGIRISKDHLIAMALQKVFLPYKNFPTVRKPAKIKESRDLIKVFFSEEEKWFYRTLYKLVRTKKEYGIDPQANLSKELLRLAINGYKQAAIGTDLDRAILDGDS